MVGPVPGTLPPEISPEMGWGGGGGEGAVGGGGWCAWGSFPNSWLAKARGKLKSPPLEDGGCIAYLSHMAGGVM